MSASHLIRAKVMFVVDCCQFGPNWTFGLKMELMAYADFGWRYNGEKLSFS